MALGKSDSDSKRLTAEGVAADRDRWLSEGESDKQYTFLNIKAVSGILRVTRAQEIARRPKSQRVGVSDYCCRVIKGKGDPWRPEKPTAKTSFLTNSKMHSLVNNKNAHPSQNAS